MCSSKDKEHWSLHFLGFAVQGRLLWNDFKRGKRSIPLPFLSFIFFRAAIKLRKVTHSISHINNFQCGISVIPTTLRRTWEMFEVSVLSCFIIHLWNSTVACAPLTSEVCCHRQETLDWLVVGVPHSCLVSAHQGSHLSFCIIFLTRLSHHPILMLVYYPFPTISSLRKITRLIYRRRKPNL